MEMEYEIVIGLEVHSQLLTESKMFCSCSSAYQDAPPNTIVCPVCMGMPGVLPVINEKAVEYVIRTGLALNCHIPEYTKFDRKNYSYPDLMKGYQISQFDLPLALGGKLAIEVDGESREIGVTRVHLEEDVAKLLHRSEGFGEGYSLLDINRAGVPLMEIVSEPDMRSPEEARSYLNALRSIVQYIGVSAGNMEEGNFRCDANISVRPFGTTELGAKVEIKNMNSFRGVFGALEYEGQRQMRALREGETIVQETRGWDDARGVTYTQRTKEDSHDYRYFPEPDLPPLVIRGEWVSSIQEELPELPQARMERFVREYSIPFYDAGLLTASKATADYYESVLDARPAAEERKHQLAKTVSNWILGEVLRLLNQTGDELSAIKVEPQQFIDLLDMIDEGTLSNNMAKTVFEEMFNTGGSPQEIAERSGLVQISDADAIGGAIDEALDGNPKAIDDYMNGKDSAVRFLVGQVMRITKGQANPQIVSEKLKEKLESMR